MSESHAEVKANPFLYNAGTELNALTALYETPLRGYDPAIGRFGGVDVYAAGYSSLTPYQYGANDPVYFNDPTGAYVGDLYGNDPDQGRRGEAGFSYVDGNNGGLNRFMQGLKDPWYDRHPGTKSVSWDDNGNMIKTDPSTGWGSIIDVNGESMSLIYKDGKWYQSTYGNYVEYKSEGGVIFEYQYSGIQEILIQVTDVESTTQSPHWLSTAESQLGVTETPGPEESTLRVLQYLYSTDTGNPGTDETPWCGAFCNWTLMKSKSPNLKTAQAWSQAYKNYGVTLNEPAMGSIAILDFGDGTGHVGFVAGINDNGDIVLLGGNQGDQVKYSVFPVNSIHSYVYPYGPWALNYNLPVLDVDSINPNTR